MTSDCGEPMATLSVHRTDDSNKKEEVRIWWNALTLVFLNCRVRKSKESPVGTLAKRHHQNWLECNLVVPRDWPVCGWNLPRHGPSKLAGYFVSLYVGTSVVPMWLQSFRDISTCWFLYVDDEHLWSGFMDQMIWMISWTTSVTSNSPWTLTYMEDQMSP